jgi:hypothetical protein
MPDPKDKLFCSQAEACRIWSMSLPTFKKEFVDTGKLTPVYLTSAETKPRPYFSMAEINELRDFLFARAKVDAAKALKKRRAAA